MPALPMSTTIQISSHNSTLFSKVGLCCQRLSNETCAGSLLDDPSIENSLLTSANIIFLTTFAQTKSVLNPHNKHTLFYM